MKVKFSVVYLLVLVGLLIGCSETDHDVVNNSPSPFPQPSPSVVHQSDPSSMTEEHTLFPSEQNNVAAGPMALPLLAPLVIPIVSCGAAVIDTAAFVLSPFEFANSFANHRLMPIATGLSLACPAPNPSKVKILMRASTIANRLKNVSIFSRWTYKANFERWIGRPVKSGYELHHTIPQNHRDFLEDVINVDHPALLIEVKSSFHADISPTWGKAWDDHLKPLELKGTTPSAQELLEHRDKLLNQQRFKPLKDGNYIELQP